MNIEFDDKALKELYTEGKTKDHKYSKLPQDVIKRYAKMINIIKAATRIEDLYRINSLHYEKKQGNLKGVDVVWITSQYRLLFYSSPNNDGIIVNALIFEISKHYE